MMVDVIVSVCNMLSQMILNVIRSQENNLKYVSVYNKDLYT